MVTKKVRCYYAIFLTLLPITALRADPGKINARVMEYQDKVHDLGLDAINAETAIKIVTLELEQIRRECERARSLFRQGHEHTNAVTSCEVSESATYTRLQNATGALVSAQRNIAIWTIRLAAENSEHPDLRAIATLYVEKWRGALNLIETQLANAKLREERAYEYYEWAISMRKKGYITSVDYDRAVTTLHTSRYEVALFEPRKKKLEENLREAEANLSKL